MSEFLDLIDEQIEQLKNDNKYAERKILGSAQDTWAELDGKKKLILGCTNYLGLANDPDIKQYVKEIIDSFGCGTSSGPRIIGVTSLHRQLEQDLAKFTGQEDALLFNSAFLANVAAMTAFTGKEDIILSDELNHASIVDGARLSSARVQVYPHCDMKALENYLHQYQDCRQRMIVSDGVFSMDGDIVPLPDMVELAKKYHAVVVIDDAHATGVVGPGGKGTPALFNLENEVDILVGTLGKAIGGAAGGFIAGKQQVIDYLFQFGRPYRFTNTLPPTVIAVGIASLRKLQESPKILEQLWENAHYLKSGLSKLGYQIHPSQTPIVPVMIHDDTACLKLGQQLYEEGVFVQPYIYPVVPRGTARIRVILSAAHTREDLDYALSAFERLGRANGLI
ncbi:glycine C-acetyltransferase [Candidatus Formimonas warabiya]|uniref:Aminotransferase class I/classII large domain-containing protein n=1 Tax=Formimonas warabiya TaxID=1761012 RepID=A0A3G1KSL4_FORW1|nr:glycine C-acetyltransferase [Candidatus Formimonas warabiya]ATW25449.1 hypothetical protein DCMF_12275 [Candidatus Formimonas warabiya]